MKNHMPVLRLRAIASVFSPSAIFLGLFLSACTSYGPAPPILVPVPSAPPAPSTGESLIAEPLHVLPTKLPKDMEDIGMLYNNDGSYSQLVPENPAGPALDAILIHNLNAGGIKTVSASEPVSPDAATLQIVVTKFRDKVKEGLVKTTQEAKIRMEAVLTLHRGNTTKTITRSMERHSSPKPVLSFETSDPPRLLGSLFSESITKDLVPFIRKKMGESP